MQFPEIPDNDRERLKNIEEFSILDSMPEREYNEITKLASYICNTPMSQLNIVHQKTQFTKSNYGIPGVYTPRELSVCAHAINQPSEVFIVPDLRKDDRFYDNPAVAGEVALVFYAGVSLISPEGFALGTLCVLDNKPHELSALQIDTLKALANQVISLLELRRSKKQLEEAKTELEEKNQELERFSYVVAHDLKSPLNNITGLAKYVIKKHAAGLDPEIQEILQTLADSSERLKRLIDGILEHSRCEKQIADSKSEVDTAVFMAETTQFFSYYKDCSFNIAEGSSKILVNKTALSQILINLISNAIKYNDKKEILIDIGFTENTEGFTFTLGDNGPGIEEKNIADIFGIFKVFADSDRFGQQGTGIGLATVKKLVTKLGGEITLVSHVGKGSVFSVTLPK